MHPATGSSVTSAVRTPDGDGYWILFANGIVMAFGDAVNFGEPDGAVGAQIQQMRSSQRGMERAIGFIVQTDLCTRTVTL